MRPRVLTSTVMILMLGGCPGAWAQEGSEGAAHFIRRVYSSYQVDHPWPSDETQLDAVWSSRMAALIRRGRELADGELSYLDVDPICNCMDVENLTVQYVRVDQDRQRPNVVRVARVARVAFINAGEPVTVLLALSGSPIEGWRIDDVIHPDGLPSFAEALADSNASIEAGTLRSPK